MNPEKLLKKGLRKIGIPYTKDQIDAFLIYLAELKKWNRAYSLTALKTEEDIVIKHFLDSALYLRAIPRNALKLADIGTGAGFPGIPIKIIRPHIEMNLIESSRKKAAFLRHILRSIGLDSIEVLEGRIEDLGKEHERNHDIIVSRATFNIKEFLDIACPYLKEDGMLIISKGPRVSKELEEYPSAKKAIKNVLRFRLPFIMAERNLVVLRCKKN